MAGSISNWTPITIEQFTGMTGIHRERALKVFDKWFGGYEEYYVMCMNRDPLLVEILEEMLTEIERDAVLRN